MQQVGTKMEHSDGDTGIVDEFIESWQILGPSAAPIHDAAQLPLRLEIRVCALRADCFWRAWRDGEQLRFVVMRVLTGPGDTTHVIEASFYDQSSELVSAGMWRRAGPGRWLLSDRFEHADLFVA